MTDELLTEQLKQIAAKLNKPGASFVVTKPTSPEHGDAATNLAMVLARPLKRAPLEIAAEIIELLGGNDLIDHIEVKAPGFINFFFKHDALVDHLAAIVAAGSKLGARDIGRGRKVVLEHTNVNPNKALHIGHLRNACLGSSCERLLEHLGYDVEAQYYVDDTGVQVAVTYLGTKNLNVTPAPGQKFDHFAQDVYVATMTKIEADPTYEAQQRTIIEELDRQEGDDVAPVKDLATKIIHSNLATMSNLGIDYDLLVWESDIIQNGFWQAAFDVLKASNTGAFVKQSSGKNAGCWVIKDVLGEDKVIVKSNGVTTYTGKDIAYHLWKFNLLGKDFRYAPFANDTQDKPLETTTQTGEPSDRYGRASMVVNFIDVRQTFPQQAVRASLEALGYAEKAEDLRHVAYGVVYLSPKTAAALGLDTSDGKTKYAMSGRRGIGVLADDLYDLTLQKVQTAFPESEVAAEVAVGAIKYHMLKYNPLTDMIFDLDQALDLHGNSGPYLQYTYARSQSILRKAASVGKSVPQTAAWEDVNEAEKDLMTSLLGFDGAVEAAGSNFEPHVLGNYLFELSQKFNSYYNSNTIVSTGEPSARDDFRILLTAAIGATLGTGLRLLGMPTPTKM